MRLAILGGGQLARMLSIAARRLDVEPWVVTPDPRAPAAPFARLVVGPLDDPWSWVSVSLCDAATAELDHAPPAALSWLGEWMPTRPGTAAVAIAGDRLREKRFFRELGIPTAPFAPVDTLAGLDRAVRRVGLPALLKTRCGGYDGLGQALVREAGEAQAAWRALDERPALLEGVVPFSREISVLAVRGQDGEVRFWSPVENHHEGGILRTSRALEPGEDAELERRGQQAVRTILSALDYVGVLAVELFDVGGELWANEMACRVHNSGHWTDVGAATSQFENHVRAVLGLPLGDTSSRGPAAMVNLVGTLPPPADLAAVPGAHVHLYDKAPRPGRKLGHVSVRAESGAELAAALRRLCGLVSRAPSAPAPAPPATHATAAAGGIR